mmetsp:Transcript_34428/g.83573  ORF Transcript_34428/g.83573 Transcript_34428/m.83573 type:complete len:305 (-) Transcript_34428:38-952(-)
MSFFMETDYLTQVDNHALREMFQFCRESVEVRNSTIPLAGRGLFATQDIPKHTIVALYATHCVGVKFPSGICQSVQVSNGEVSEINHDKSQYSLFTYGDRRICGANLQEDFNGAKLFVDMNPAIECTEGWYGGMLNDGAIVEYPGDLDYYEKSRSKMSVELVPFSTAPFHVGVTTRDVKKGDELFVSYGYNYWTRATNNYLSKENGASLQEVEKFTASLHEQETQVVSDIARILDIVELKYQEESWVLGQIFDHGMNSERPPLIQAPIFEPEPSAVEEEKGGGGIRKRLRRKIKELVRKVFAFA